MGEAQLEIGLTEKALANGLKSLEYATIKQYPRGIRDANELLAKVYEQKGNFSLALHHSKAYHTAKDSMTDAESISRVAKKESELNYRQERLTDSINTEAQKAAFKNEIALKDAKAEKQALTNYLLILAVAFAVILVYFVYSRYKKSKRQNDIIQEQKSKLETSLTEITKRDEEKEILLKEIHHRVKNNLQVVSSLLELQAKKGGYDEKNALEEGKSRVRAMALIHEKLYQNEDISSINFNDYARQLSRQIKSLFKGYEHVKIQISGEKVLLDIDTAVPLGLILNELVTNAFKYGLKQNGILEINISTNNNECYNLKIKDCGNGLPDDFDIKKSTSLGLKLVNRLSKQLYGKTKYSFDQGAVFSVTFKDTLQRKEVA